MIKRLVAFDMDGTLMDTPMPDAGKQLWASKKGTPYPYVGWWGRPESLDLSVFDIKPFPSVMKQLEKEISTPDTYVIILTSRMEKLRPQVQAILDKNNIHVDSLDMKKSEKTKGEKILEYVKHLPELEEISVYDDREGDILSYKGIRSLLPQEITFNIYVAMDGNFTLTESHDKLLDMVNEEISNFNANTDYIYHGTNDGSGYHIQRDGRMRINAANNNEPFISFTSIPDTAKYYANAKGGSNRGIILRIKKTDDFTLSPKFDKNNGYEWITTIEIPVSELEINTAYGWIPLSSWDFIDKKPKI
jgi:cellobiose-specific phosphotransferase system component IIB